MKRLILWILVLVFVGFNFISCQTPEQGKLDSKKPGNGIMVPTSEYNYMLDPATLLQAAQTMEIENELFYNPETGKIDAQLPFISNTEINGQTDGTRIIVDAKYTYAANYVKYGQVLASFPKDKSKLRGSVKSDKLIGYAKLPGLQTLFDAALEITNIETPEGQTNEFAQMMQMASLFVNLQEDIFKWMGNEMGLITFIAADELNIEYPATALALSVTNAKTANEKTHNLFTKLSLIAPDLAPNEILETSQYKAYIIDSINTESLGFGSGMDSDLGLGFDNIVPGIMYTDDWMFIADVTSLKHLADMYDPGAALGTESSMAFSINLDKAMEHSHEYEEEIFASLITEIENSPEQMEILQNYRNRFEKMKIDKQFGTTSLTITFEKDHIKAQMETTKQFIELMEFMKEWMEAVKDADA